MPTSHADLFTALAMPFEGWEVESFEKPLKGGQVIVLWYVRAESIANRLDDVLGPENWWVEYETPKPESSFYASVICKLSIRLPDGTVVTKWDAGGKAPKLDDPGDADKSGFTDAFKRAARTVGIGRYLCKHGVPVFAREAFNREEERINKGLAPTTAEAPPPAREIMPPAKPPAPKPAPKPARKLHPALVSARAFYDHARATGYLSPIAAWGRDQPGFDKMILNWNPGQLAAALDEIERLQAQRQVSKAG